MKPGTNRFNISAQTFRRTIAVAMLLLSFSVVAVADEASKAYQQGRDAEARLDYESAYKFYAHAYELKPKNLAYRSSATRIRVLASSQHVHRGQQLREAGRLDAAMTEFQQALAIDPTSFIAEQEIRRTKVMIEAAQHKETKPTGPTEVQKMEERVEASTRSVELIPLSPTPISLKMTEDVKAIYSIIGKIAGINVLFDPDLPARKTSVELSDVTLLEALDSFAMQSKTFWRPVTHNTIYVSPDTQAKRRDVEQNVLMTFYLSNLTQPTELQDVTNALRTLLDMNKIVPLPKQNAIGVRGTPDQIALAGKLIDDMDKAPPEVVVEVAVMEVRHDRVRDLGIQPPTSTTISVQAPNTTNGSGGAQASGAISLNDLSSLTAQNFSVTIPAATATALLSDSNSRLIQNPSLRVIDGQKGTLKIGERVPVATGSFSAGAVGGIGVSPLVNTQFNYIDVGVNVDVTPRVHVNENEVTLKVVLEISAVDSTTNIGGISQPLIGQRKIEHEMRLKDGDINVVGGMLEEVDSKAVSGYPWLSSVPFLKYFVSSEHTEKRQNELVFVLIPHIVRGRELSALNQKPLDVGTSSVISLRHSPSETAKLEPVAARMPRQQPTPNNPEAAHSPQPVQPKATVLSFEPSDISTDVGQSFSVQMMVDGAEDLASVPMQLQYDRNALQLDSISPGALLSSGQQLVAVTHGEDVNTGTTWINATRPPGAPGVSGAGQVLVLRFTAKAPGTSTLSIARAGLKNSRNESIAAAGVGMNIVIKPKK